MWNYLMSIIIFYIIIKASISISKIFLDSKGRLEKIIKYNEENNRVQASILATSCVPILRLIVVIAIYHLCFCNDKQFNEIFKKN